MSSCDSEKETKAGEKKIILSILMQTFAGTSYDTGALIELEHFPSF